MTIPEMFSLDYGIRFTSLGYMHILRYHEGKIGMDDGGQVF